MPDQIERWQMPDNFRVNRHQQLVDAINGHRIARSDDYEIRATPSGTHVAAPADPQPYFAVKVKITAHETDSGKYKGYIVRGVSVSNPNTAGSPGKVQEPEGMTVPSTSGNEDALIINTAEDGRTGWEFSTFPLYAIGVVTGKSTDGRYVVEFTTLTLPPPTARYQVYTPIDDSLAPIWTDIRFSS